MQPLTADTRSSYTPAQVTAALQANPLTVGYGLELLDANLNVQADISAALATGTVERDCLATVHASVSLTLSQQLAWATLGAQVRPYQLLSGAGLSKVRWNLGVYVLTTPDTASGDSPATWTVTGYDRLYLLNQPIGTSYGVPAGTNVLNAVRAAITAAGVTGPVLLDSTAAAKTLAADRTWLLDATNEAAAPTWLDVVNDLLKAVGYRGLWADQNGNFVSVPWITPRNRPIEWAFDTGMLTSLVGVKRALKNDYFNVPNTWIFIRRGLTSQPKATDGSDGLYQYVDASGTPNSVATLGYTKRKITYVDAADQASLLAQAGITIAADQLTTRTLTLNSAPFPGAGHFDIYSFTDPVLGQLLVQATTWKLPLDGSDMSWTWNVVV